MWILHLSLSSWLDLTSLSLRCPSDHRSSDWICVVLYIWICQNSATHNTSEVNLARAVQAKAKQAAEGNHVCAARRRNPCFNLIKTTKPCVAVLIVKFDLIGCVASFGRKVAYCRAPLESVSRDRFCDGWPVRVVSRLAWRKFCCCGPDEIGVCVCFVSARASVFGCVYVWVCVCGGEPSQTRRLLFAGIK